MECYSDLDINMPALQFASHTTVKAFTELPINADEKRKGGFLTIRDRERGHILYTLLIGQVSHEKADKYQCFSWEKGGRLRSHVTSEDKHLSSWQSRDPDRGYWGGAIVTKKYIVSFSGLPELGDEAVSMIVAIRMYWMSKQEAERIARLSKNPFFVQLNSKVSS